MAGLTHGMNPTEVEDLGRHLQAQAAELERLVDQLDRSVRSTSWQGADAQRFRTQWWPAHRTRLAEVAESVKGFGQSALNNAAEQRRASGASGAASVDGGTGSAARKFSDGALGRVEPSTPSASEQALHLAEQLPVAGSLISLGLASKGFFYDTWEAGFEYGFDSQQLSDVIVRSSAEGIDAGVGILGLDAVSSETALTSALIDNTFGTDIADHLQPGGWIDDFFGVRDR